jgi:hypothetical protein
MGKIEEPGTRDIPSAYSSFGDCLDRQKASLAPSEQRLLNAYNTSTAVALMANERQEIQSRAQNALIDNKRHVVSGIFKKRKNESDDIKPEDFPAQSRKK